MGDWLEAALRDAVGPSAVLTDPRAIAPYCTDWSGRFRGAARAVVRPASVAEVAAVVVAVVTACRRCPGGPLAIVPQGGSTGLVGGATPAAGEVVVSLARLDGVEVDPAAGQVTAGAGATLADVQREARAHGWDFGVDLASRDRATVGGMIATNAGGLRVMRFGDTRAQVVGVEAVLGDGSIVSHLGGLVKDNTGYHLPSLLCGSEGTLGIVTAARLRLVAPPAYRAAVLVGFSTVAAAAEGAGALRRAIAPLEAAELMLGPGIELVCAAFGWDPPLPRAWPAYLLVEAGDRTSPAAELAAAARALPGSAELRVAESDAARAALWRYREHHPAAVNTIGPAHKLDVAVGPGRLAELAAAAPAAVAAVAPAARTWMWGHAGDGNLHVNVTGVDPTDESVDGAVFALVSSMGGSISAEHGIGVAKRSWLGLSRSPAEIAAFRAIKRALDPDRVLNPRVLV